MVVPGCPRFRLSDRYRKRVRVSSVAEALPPSASNMAMTDSTRSDSFSRSRRISVKIAPWFARGSHGQNGHQVWNVRSGTMVRLSAASAGRSRAQARSPWGESGIQVLKGDAAAQSLCRQEEGSVAPVTLYGQLSRAVKAAAGNGEVLQQVCRTTPWPAASWSHKGRIPASLKPQCGFPRESAAQASSRPVINWLETPPLIR